jgi:LAO/AO transport system kinase
MPEDRISRLLDGLIQGDRSAISEALNLADDRRPEQRDAALDLLDRIEAHASSRGARRVGITGAPGAGKSSLLNALVEELRGRERSIGIIAVDPSSQRSGGALLGDRMRLGASARERGVFLRSMAARDRLGGLADATHASVSILSAVFDLVFVETVGVGQSECDVAQLVDTLVLVVQPGAGDMLQFMKAGILELPDIFVVNKADTGPIAERTRGELLAGLGLGAADGGDWRAPVLLTSARDRTGIDALANAIEAHREALEQSGGLARKRERSRISYVAEALARRYGEYGLEQIGGRDALQSRMGDADTRSAYRLVRELGGEIEDALRKP